MYKILFFITLTISAYSQKSNPYQFSDSIWLAHQLCYQNNDTRDCEKVTWELAFIGKHQDVLKALDRYYDESKIITMTAKDSAYFKSLKKVDANAFLLKNTRNEQVVMFNERHYNPLNRVFVMNLLDSLYAQGFRYLALEAISHKRARRRNAQGQPIELPQPIKLPMQDLGYYTSEPQFGNLIRKAIQKGFTIHGYDDQTTATMDRREQAEAKNIAEILEKDPSAKILVYAGSGHIREDTLRQKMMAYYFHKKTGINPLTINVNTGEHLNTAWESPYYRLSQPMNTPSIFLDSMQKPFVTQKGVVDIHVYCPRTQYHQGRPSWLYNNAAYQHKKVSLEEVSSLIKAYISSELEALGEANAVPVDVIEVTEKQKEALLLLPFDADYTILFDSRSKRSTKKIKKG